MDDTSRSPLSRLAIDGTLGRHALRLASSHGGRHAGPTRRSGGKAKAVSYHTEILPILQANCQGCHQPAKASGKLDMTVFKSLLAAGESGTPAIVPGKPDDSYLLEQITPDNNGEAAMPQRQAAAGGERHCADPPLD